MLDELQRRNYSEHTTRSYIRTVEDFARRFNRPPDRLGPRHVREYQAELFLKRKLSPGSVAVRLAALRPPPQISNLPWSRPLVRTMQRLCVVQGGASKLVMNAGGAEPQV